MNINLNERAQEVHKANAKWWYDIETGERLERNKGELLMLVVSEIAETMEGERKNLMDDHLPHRRMAEVEMADAYIRLLDYAAGNNYDLSNFARAIWEDYLPSNKGDALFEITKAVSKIESPRISAPSSMIELVIDLIYAYCEKHSYDLEGAYHEKMAYNSVRADHQKEARLAANGKKW